MIKYISKTLAKQMIDEAPGETIMIITYDKVKGVSDCGAKSSKYVGKILVNESGTLLLNDSDFFNTIMLENIKPIKINKGISKSILLSKYKV